MATPFQKPLPVREYARTMWQMVDCIDAGDRVEVCVRKRQAIGCIGNLKRDTVGETSVAREHFCGRDRITMNVDADERAPGFRCDPKSWTARAASDVEQ